MADLISLSTPPPPLTPHPLLPLAGARVPDTMAASQEQEGVCVCVCGGGGYPVIRRIKPSLTLNSLHSGIDAFTGGILPAYSSCFFRRSVRSSPLSPSRLRRGTGGNEIPGGGGGTFCFCFCLTSINCEGYIGLQTELRSQGSRRDQEEGGGAGPSSSPRRDHEQGGGIGLRKLDFFRFGLFLNSSATDIVLVTLPKHGS